MKRKNQAAIGFRYSFVMRDAGGFAMREWTITNLFPIQGRDHMLDSAIGGGSQVVTWYVGLFKGDYEPVETDTMSTFVGAATEFTAYSEPNRIVLAAGSASGGAIDNVDVPARFTFTANDTIYGAFISSSLGKGSGAGILLSAGRFDSPEVIRSGRTLDVKAGCVLVNVE